MKAQFVAHLKSLGTSPNTVKSYLSDLNIAEKRGIISLDLKTVNMAGLLNLPVSPSTKHRIRAAINKYANYLVSINLLPSVPSQITSIQLPKITKKLPKVTLADETRNILSTVKDPEIKLILLLLSVTGCRISSLVNLKIEDFTNEFVTFHTAKGNKPYISFISNEVHTLFNICRQNRTSGYLFVGEGGNPISTDAIRLRLKRNLGDKYRNPHSFRHGIATELITNGADIYDVKEFLNHTSINTTEKYIHLSPKVIANRLKSKHPLLK